MSDECFKISTNKNNGSCFFIDVQRGNGCFTVSVDGVDYPSDEVLPGSIEIPGDSNQKIKQITRIDNYFYLVVDKVLGRYEYFTKLDESITDIYSPVPAVNVEPLGNLLRLETYNVNGSDTIALFAYGWRKMHYFDFMLLNPTSVVTTLNSDHVNAYMSEDSYVNGGTDHEIVDRKAKSFDLMSYSYRHEDEGCTPTPNCSESNTTCRTYTSTEYASIVKIRERYISNGEVARYDLKSPFNNDIELMDKGCYNEGEHVDQGKDMYYPRDYFGYTYSESDNYYFKDNRPSEFNITSKYILNVSLNNYQEFATYQRGITGGDMLPCDVAFPRLNSVNFSMGGNVAVSESGYGEFAVFDGSKVTTQELPEGCMDFVIGNNALYYVIGDNRIYWIPIVIDQ